MLDLKNLDLNYCTYMDFKEPITNVYDIWMDNHTMVWIIVLCIAKPVTIQNVNYFTSTMDIKQIFCSLIKKNLSIPFWLKSVLCIYQYSGAIGVCVRIMALI